MSNTHDRNLEVMRGPEQLVRVRVEELADALVELKVGAIASGAEFQPVQVAAAAEFDAQVNRINPTNNPLMQGVPQSPEVTAFSESRRAEEALQAVDAALSGRN